MVWQRLDDRLHSHPKAAEAGLEAIGLWALSLSHVGDHRTDGHVSRAVASHAECERYIATRLEEGAAQTTIKKELRALKAVLSHARRNEKFMRDPDAVVPELEDTYRPRERWLTPLELVGLATALPPLRRRRRARALPRGQGGDGGAMIAALFVAEGRMLALEHCRLRAIGEVE